MGSPRDTNTIQEQREEERMLKGGRLQRPRGNSWKEIKGEVKIVMALYKYIPLWRSMEAQRCCHSKAGSTNSKWHEKPLLKLFFQSVLSVHVCCGSVLHVRYCVAPTSNPGQTAKWHLGREPDSSWPVLHPFSLECRWKHEPVLWTFLAPSSMAVNGPQVPYLQLIWILCNSKVLSVKDYDECYASACGFWQSDSKRGRTNFENNTSF